MNRREFLFTGLVGPLALRQKQPGASEPAGYLLKDGRILDGFGRTAYHGDILIVGDRIRRIGKIRKAGRAEVIALAGRCVAPGFIDIHTHTDSQLTVNPHAESKLRQGVTTELTGNCGSSAVPSRRNPDLDFVSYTASLEALPLSINYASLVGHGSLRAFVVGEENRLASATELAKMKELLDLYIGQGAFGLASGLEYTPGSFAGTEELAELNRVTRLHNALYATHMRNEGDRLIEAIQEAIDVAQRSGARLEISHLKTEGRSNWSKIDAALGEIESARKKGLDIHFDRYPYIAFSTGLATIYPLWLREGGPEVFLSRLKDDALMEKARTEVEAKVRSANSWDAYFVASVEGGANKWTQGKSIQQVADNRKIAPFDAARALMIEEKANVSIVAFAMNEDNLVRILQHPLAMIGSDGNALAAAGPLAEGRPHPRSFGTFPRVLGLYAREKKAFRLEDAVKKMTSLPAAKMKLPQRGGISTGYFADLVIFDPEKIADTATFENPFNYPTGIDYVFVNGICALRNGEINPQRSGRVLRYGSRQ
ncbi:MAG TPA: D-aminoacylase [Acidobacteriota bacterium]|jgi:N-acyl-D-amino-acid deacylase|nr:D-aminoacylase [Acidobacteriota bacterium]